MNILVTGANGQLGSEVRIASHSSEDNYIFTDVNTMEGQETIPLDITDRDAVFRMVREQEISAIINCAAYTNVDAAEDNRPLAERLNADAPENLAFAMRDVGGLLIHISTDYVFGKEPYNTPCNETQQGTPTGIYGLTKKLGEEKIINTGCQYIIIRTAWLYSEFGKNFCKTMLSLLSSKPILKVVVDQVGTPTYAFDLAMAICKIISQRSYIGATGIYHFSNEGVCSWYDFTKMIQTYSGLFDCDVQPCRSDEFPSKVVRPSYSVLDKTKIKNIFGLHVPYWTDSLQVCLKNMGVLYKDFC